MKRYFSGAVIGLVVVILLGLCLSTPAIASKEPVKIAGIYPTQGPMKSMGDMLARGIKLAVKKVNEEGGILDGRPVELRVYDEGYSAEEAATSAKKAIDEGCKAISAAAQGFLGLVIQSVAKEANLPIGIGIPASKKFVSSEYGFHGAIHVGLHIRPIEAPYTRWIAKKGHKTISFLNYDSEYTRAADFIYDDLYKKADSPLKIIRKEWMPVGKISVELETSKLAREKPDFIHAQIWGSPGQVSFFKTLKQHGFKGGKGIVDACLQIESVNADPEAAEGAVCPFPYMANPSKESQEYEKAFIEEWGRPSSTIAYLSYEATMILLKGMDRAGTDSDTKKIADAMHSLSWVTPRGEPLKIRENGQVHYENLLIGQVRNGKIVYVDKMPILEDDWIKPETKY